MDIAVWEKLWDKLSAKVAAEGLDALTSDQRHWYLLRKLINDTEDDGLLGFYSNCEFDAMVEIELLLQAVGAKELREILSKVNGLLAIQIEECESINPDLSELWQDDDFREHICELEDELFGLLPSLEKNLDEIAAKIL